MNFEVKEVKNESIPVIENKPVEEDQVIKLPPIEEKLPEVDELPQTADQFLEKEIPAVKCPEKKKNNLFGNVSANSAQNITKNNQQSPIKYVALALMAAGIVAKLV